LFSRRRGDALELRAGDEKWPALPFPANDNGFTTVRAWQDLERHGFKIRSRALTNTLYARLFLADLFIHGIGGGKYDELTDVLITRCYGLEPPAFLVLSATLLLPLPHYPADAAACRQLGHEVRDVHYNPQRHLSLDVADARIRNLMSEKQEWIARPSPTRAERRERFRRLRQLTEELRKEIADREQSLRSACERCGKELQANAVLRRRDYAFCLYPEGTLREFCTRFLGPAVGETPPPSPAVRPTDRSPR
jgi:hypothetical protein